MAVIENKLLLFYLYSSIFSSSEDFISENLQIHLMRLMKEGWNTSININYLPASHE